MGGARGVHLKSGGNGQNETEEAGCSDTLEVVAAAVGALKGKGECSSL